MKHKCLNVEVIEWPKASEGHSSSSGRQDERLFVEAQYAKPVDDEVQTPLEESLELLEDRRNPHPNRWEHGKLQRAEVSHIA